MEIDNNIPYRSKLTEKIEPGQTLIIRGRTGDDAKRFNINLHKDSPDFSGNDVPLHVSVRFDEGKQFIEPLVAFGRSGFLSKWLRAKSDWQVADSIAHDVYGSKFQNSR
ncbi:unnamed protein product [Nippostrongylus brasiliensis]|uniref:Galectin n=1 Tax=Nippostrongylus brasiliensis TaxID=27835 RepID=A0A0N4XCS2_NIPBR|nr:unnamed protein product [Nippostrongylus brasiliensis]